LYARKEFKEVEIPIEDVVKTVLGGETVDGYGKDGDLWSRYFTSTQCFNVRKHVTYKVKRLLPPNPDTIK
jgi:hypothetical protein